MFERWLSSAEDGHFCFFAGSRPLRAGLQGLIRGARSDAASGLAKRQSATPPKSGRQGEKSRQVFGERSAHFLSIGGRFFIDPKRMSKQNGYICAKRAPTCAGLLHFAAEGAHRHRTDGR